MALLVHLLCCIFGFNQVSGFNLVTATDSGNPGQNAIIGAPYATSSSSPEVTYRSFEIWRPNDGKTATFSVEGWHYNGGRYQNEREVLRQLFFTMVGSFAQQEGYNLLCAREPDVAAIRVN